MPNMSEEVSYKNAWNELYKCFGERMQQMEIDLMDSVLTSVKLDEQYFGKPIISHAVIQNKIDRLSKYICSKYPDGVTMVVVLNGAVPFAIDLLNRFSLKYRQNIELEFISIRSYKGTKSTGKVDIIKDIDIDIKGKDVLVIEDIVDTGKTINRITNHLWMKYPKSIEVCSLIIRVLVGKDIINGINYIGFTTTGNDFLIGYGLDLDGKYRCLPDIYAIPREVRGECPKT